MAANYPQCGSLVGESRGNATMAVRENRLQGWKWEDESWPNVGLMASSLPPFCTSITVEKILDSENRILLSASQRVNTNPVTQDVGSTTGTGDCGWIPHWRSTGTEGDSD